MLLLIQLNIIYSRVQTEAMDMGWQVVKLLPKMIRRRGPFSIFSFTLYTMQQKDLYEFVQLCVWIQILKIIIYITVNNDRRQERAARLYYLGFCCGYFFDDMMIVENASSNSQNFRLVKRNFALRFSYRVLSCARTYTQYAL